MGIYDELRRASDEIMGRVDSAINSGDFSHLSSDINRQIRNVQREFSDQARNVTDSVRDSARQFSDQVTQSVKNATGSASNQKPFTGSMHVITKEHQTAFMRQKPFKGIKGERNGFIALFLIGLMFTVEFIVLTVTSSLRALIGVGACAAACIFFIIRIRKYNRLIRLREKYRQFAGIVGNDEYITIDELSIRTREPRELLVKEIEDMISHDMLPGAVFDKDKTVLILSEYAYRYYVDYEKKQSAEEASEEGLPEDARAVIEQGRKYIDDFRHLDEIIPDQSMSDKLQRLVGIIQKIFEEIKRKPGKAGSLRRLLDYYLPTTEKLVKAYADAENQPDTSSITQMKTEIESSLDMINDACEKIFNDMFTDDAWDVASDINVMKQMMEQDGLVNDDMKG